MTTTTPDFIEMCLTNKNANGMDEQEYWMYIYKMLSWLITNTVTEKETPMTNNCSSIGSSFK